uniref:TFIIE beta domain-containing protein n=1 Tax=Babesia bovis TaxID=5865 RepID=S6B7F9_BABBO|nr:hypothetical protein [Babesia bovis]
MSLVGPNSSFNQNVDTSSQPGSQVNGQPVVLPFSRASNITYKGNSCPIVYVVHKIIAILSQHNRALHTLEVEKALRSLGFMGVDICTNKELFESLLKVQRIEFDVVRKRLLYKNPFESVTDSSTLVDYINKNYLIKGLRVNNEMLNCNPNMAKWIDEALKNRKLRAVRLTVSHIKGKYKCRYAGKPNQCSLYTVTKCVECSTNFKDVLLFPLGKEQYEQDRLNFASDIKDLWDSVTLPPIEDLLKEYNMSHVERTFINVPSGTGGRRQRNKQGIAGIKMRKIYNTHLFTAQELSADMSRNQTN